MTLVYKLNIFKETGEDYNGVFSLLPVSHFMNIDPIYINMENIDIDQFNKQIFTLLAENIIMLKNCEIKPEVLGFEIIKDNYIQKPIYIKNNFTSIMDLLLENNVLIYKHYNHITWYRYCIGFTKSSCKGNEYTIEEIKIYISKMFGNNN